MKGPHLTKRIKLNVKKCVISFFAFHLCFRGPVSLMSAEKHNSFIKSSHSVKAEIYFS